MSSFSHLLSLDKFGIIPLHPSEEKKLKENYISVRKIESYKYEIIEGQETGNKELEKSLEYDDNGNLILEVFGSEDSTFYGNYNLGFWGYKKMSKQDTIYQYVKFDLSGNVIYHCTINPNLTDDSLISISTYNDQGNIVLKSSNASKYTWKYNQGKDSIVKEFPAVKQNWEYENQKVVKYSKFENNVLAEARTFTYSHDTITYVKTFYANGEPYPTRDSTVGIINDFEDVLHVFSYTFGELEPHELNFTYNQEGQVIEILHGCSKFVHEFDKKGRLIKTESYNCEGELRSIIRKKYFVEN